jgi:hypothetical protein
MTQAAAKTGVGPTVTVAVEQHFPEEQRIIELALDGQGRAYLTGQTTSSSDFPATNWPLQAMMRRRKPS